MFHVIHHHRRKAYRLVTVEEDQEFIFDQLAYEPPVPQELSNDEVLAALDRVPEHFRAVILLADVQEFSYKEVAEALGVPIGTVMSRLNRGRKLLRATLASVAATYGFRPAEEDMPAVEEFKQGRNFLNQPVNARWQKSNIFEGWRNYSHYSRKRVRRQAMHPETCSLSARSFFTQA